MTFFSCCTGWLLLSLVYFREKGWFMLSVILYACVVYVSCAINDLHNEHLLHTNCVITTAKRKFISVKILRVFSRTTQLLQICTIVKFVWPIPIQN